MDIICEYGCGQKATHRFKSRGAGWCCSKSTSSCPGMKLRNSATHKIKNLRKGKSFEEIFGKEKARLMKLKITIANKARIINPEDEKIRRSKISASMKKNPNGGGSRPGSGKGKKSCYKTLDGHEVHLDSTWELKYVQYLDKNNIGWVRNTTKFPYIWNDDIKYYIPDFYLPDNNIYVEIKGYERENDKFKWNDFPHELIVLKESELKDLGIL